jgi:hypothetical protein
MLGAEGDKPVGKSGQRKGKAAQPGKKGEPRKRKEGQARAAKPDQLLEARETASTHVEEQLSEHIPEPAAPVMPTESRAAETSPVEISPVAAVEPAGETPVSLQTIANAYGDYSKKSFEQTSSFVAKLAGAGSLAKAFELQTAFAREAYETFVAESCRIRELHGELAKQRFARLENLATRMTQGAFNPTRKT